MVPPLLHVSDGVLALRVIESFVLDIRHFGKGPVALMRLPSRGVQALPEVVPEASFLCYLFTVVLPPFFIR